MTENEIQSLLAEATPGPWRASVHQGPNDVSRGKVWAWANGYASEVCILTANVQIPTNYAADSRLAAAAPELAAEVLRLRAELAQSP